jgi:hypothetical protein
MSADAVSQMQVQPDTDAGRELVDWLPGLTYRQRRILRDKVVAIEAAARKAIEDDIRADEAGKWREAVRLALSVALHEQADPGCTGTPPYDVTQEQAEKLTAAIALTREASGG